jgi:cellulose synthase operon protein C
MPLRLIAARGGVGIELYEPHAFGPITLAELQWSLPGLSFPIDLSGGVREFRHRRGELQHARIEIDLGALQRWLSPRLGSLLGGLAGRVSVWAIPGGLGIGIPGQQGAAAFELLWAPQGEEARFVVRAARAAGVAGPEVSTALLAVDSMLGKHGTRRGRLVRVPGVLSELLALLLPELGVRVPACKGVWLSQLRVEDELLSVSADLLPAAPALPPTTVSALEFAGLAQAADEHLLAGRVDEAREAYLGALERAPRHPELVHAIAAIDKDFAERAEAALGLLVEALPATAYGWVGAQLLAQVGDEEGAELAIARQAVNERFAPLAAELWFAFSQLCLQPRRKLSTLDQALAVSPSHQRARWARFCMRVDQADVNGALADAEHLEAAVRGSAAKHRAALQTAQALSAAGYVQPAQRLFERALRYLPKDPHATLGLAQAFIAQGNGKRALVLLQRAEELLDASDAAYSEVQLQLGKLLAEGTKDRSAAISRVRQVNGPAALVAQARALEGRWRGELGDHAGAALAFARLRDAVELATTPSAAWGPWLLEAAQCSRALGDLRSAERHLAVAMRIAPTNSLVQQQFRVVAGELNAANAAAERFTPVLSKPVLPRESAAEEPQAPESSHDSRYEAEDELTVEGRAARLQAEWVQRGGLSDPDFTQLVRDLLRLGRRAEVYALVWGRYEDAAPSVQQSLLPQLRDVFQQLIDLAEREGAASDAELYREQLQQLFS